MTSWNDVVAAAPEFARSVESFFDAGKHKTLATLRRDGSPRISGIETTFRDGDLWLGSMWRALKALDLQRDPRFALHSPSISPPDWKGDAKIAGRAVEITEQSDLDRYRGETDEEMPPGSFHLFRADITEVVLIGLGGDPPDHIVIETWKPGQALRRADRY